MKSLAVCDDDETFLAQACELARRFFASECIPATVVCFPDAESLLADGAHYDIYLLDVLMPGMDGIALAKELARTGQDFCIIYLTTSEEYALEAFAVDALQYLVKPVSETAFFGALKKALTLLARAEPESPPLLVPTPEGGTSISLSELHYVEHAGKVLYFHLANGEVLRSSTGSMKISDLGERLLSLPNFLRPHRSFLVNMDYIRTFSSEEILMPGGASIPVTRAGCRETRRRYMDYLLKRKGPGLC